MEKLVDEKFTAINLGNLDNLKDYVLPLPSGEVKGKIFLGKILGLTGANLSFQSFPVGSESGFYHTHKTHEEVYIFLKGKGEYQVNGKIFEVKEGTVVKVVPDAKRTVRNIGKEPLVMICIQYREGTYSSEDELDGVILNETVKW